MFAFLRVWTLGYYFSEVQYLTRDEALWTKVVLGELSLRVSLLRCLPHLVTHPGFRLHQLIGLLFSTTLWA